MTEHYLLAEHLHFAWDNSIPPVLEIEAGDTVTFDTWDASGHFYSSTSTSADVARRQGDGEVCITAVEMDSTTRLRFSLSDVPVREPQLRLKGPPTTIGGPYHGCTAPRLTC